MENWLLHNINSSSMYRCRFTADWSGLLLLETLQPRHNAESDNAYGVPRAGKQRNHLLQKKYRVKAGCGRGFAMTTLVCKQTSICFISYRTINLIRPLSAEITNIHPARYRLTTGAGMRRRCHRLSACLPCLSPAVYHVF